MKHRQLGHLTIFPCRRHQSGSAHGSGYIAAFIGGLLFAAIMKKSKHKHEVLLAAESTGEAFALITWMLFGSAIIGQAFGNFRWEMIIYALLSLTAIRMLPIFLSLTGTGERTEIRKLFWSAVWQTRPPWVRRSHMMNRRNVDQTVTRRQFFRTGMTVAGGIAAATVGASSNAFAAWPPGETPKDKGHSNVKNAYEMYTHSQDWSEDDVVWWEGRRVGGIAIGVIQLSANIPMIPGNMGNASTFKFPILYEPMEVTGDMVVSTKPHPEVLKRSVEAARKLEAQGVRAICGNCGFFANYQKEVATELDVPFFSSSLLQIPLILISLKPDQKVGVITADGLKLTQAPALENCGVTDRSRIVIAGAENTSEMKKILGTTGAYNPRRFELQLVDIAKEMVSKNSEISAILLECTELPPHARAIQKAVAMPVWGFPTMVNWIYNGVVRRSFKGFI